MATLPDNALWMPRPTPPPANANPDLTLAQSRTPRENNNGQLDREAFLMLLITQLRHQDPLNPMEDRDFIAQMAQFSALEQMQIQTRAVEQQQAFSMIGKTIHAHWFDEATNDFRDVTGLVSSVTSRFGQIFLQVDGVDVPLQNVQVVAEDHFTSMQLQGILESVASTRDLALVGQWIQAITVDGRGQATGFVEGIVDYVRFVDGQSVLMVGGREVFTGEVMSVSRNALVTGQTISAVINEGGQQGQLQTVTGPIQGINVRNNTAFIVVGQGSGTVEVPLQRIDFLVESLQMIGQHVDHAAFSGEVHSITVRSGIPYLNIGDTSLSFAVFRSGETE
jgi:flagellar basal-body rod modification protein FlgD